ncbi:MAG: CCA tRNA nucleotidyltransferase [Candidatus Gracilibacteria bacterium]|nr:CCA tRNA nucleotidyltransferase [Candidatus Gracilibacteria bacterium]
MQEVKTIAKKIEKIGKKTYIVGGYNRDILLGLPAGDIDLSTDATLDEVKSALKVVGEIGKKYGTLIVNENRKIFEITTFREDIGSINNRKPAKVIFTQNIQKDASRRDFTINAIYYNILEKKYINPVGGIEDLENKKINFIGKTIDRIDEDALRILRFIRFKNKYNLEAKQEDFEIISEKISLLKNISRERIREEFDKILLDKNNTSSLEDLKKIGFFNMFMPSIENMEKAPGGKSGHQEGNVWIHTKMVIEELNKANIQDICLYYTALYHDTGKVDTFYLDKKGEVHYPNHAEFSLNYFKTEKKNLIFSKKEEKRIQFLIENHDKIYRLDRLELAEAIKFVMHKYFPDLLILMKADSYGKIPVNTKKFNERLEFIDKLISASKKVKLLTGSDIIKKYPNLKGGEIGKKLKGENNKILNNIEL